MYYVYRHIRLDKNIPFYIGIGERNIEAVSHETEYIRAYDKGSRNKFWNRIVNKTKYEVEIVFECEDLIEIKKKETEFIKLYGRSNLCLGPLCNLTDGGDGTYGYTPTEETKDNLRKAARKKFDSGYRPNSKCIFQYNASTGGFIKKWNCITEASISIKCSKSNLSKVVISGGGFCKNYLWYSEYKGDIVEPKTGSVRDYSGVVMLDKDTECVIKEFNSISDAFRFVSKKHSGYIRKACQNQHTSAYGYKWRYR